MQHLGHFLYLCYRSISTVTEKDMIEGCRRGDISARRELYERLSGLMYGVCCRYVKDRDMAKDLLHDGFIVLYTKIGEFRGEGSFEGWCRRVFINTILGHLRKNDPLQHADRIENLFMLNDREFSVLEKLSAQELVACIGDLPEGYRTILNLHAIEGYSHKEVASMLGINENTSRSQYSRARNKLQEILKNRE